MSGIQIIIYGDKMKFHEFLICVATVNGPERLESFIKSIFSHTNNLDFAISIVDDCSDLSLSEKNYQLAVKYGCYYHRNNNRSGVPVSWNKATEAADAKYLVIANDDIIVCDGWLEAFKLFWENNLNLKIGVVAWPATNILSNISKKTSFEVLPDLSHLTNPVVACSGYCFATTRELFMEVGRFDERYFATWEEIDFGAKLCMNGYKSIGLSDPVIYHQGGASFSDPINQHPAMSRQSLAQSQWIDKWSTILNIPKNNDESIMIKNISISLISKIPNYNMDLFFKTKFKKNLKESLENIKKKDDIEGWFDWENLYRDFCIKIPNNGIAIEVGSWMGSSAIFFAECIKESGKNIKFYCVDIWDDSFDHPAFDSAKNIAKKINTNLIGLFEMNVKKYNCDKIINAIKGDSNYSVDKFEDNSIDLVFIDADHSYEAVKNDITLWWNKLKVGGIMAGHDYFWSADGVKKAVDEFFTNKNIKINTNGQCWLVEKPNE
jgi:GT2 family glycosyltransferase/predicted O-methyltransferase YrrM